MQYGDRALTVNWYNSSIRYFQKTVISIDPGINTTGVAVFRDDGDSVNLLEAIAIKSPPSLSLASDKVQHITDACLASANHHQCDILVMEIPPSTIYGYSKLNKSKLIARAQSIFKTFWVMGAIAQELQHARFITKRLYVLPVQWEPSKKSRGGMAIKEWSLMNANQLLREQGMLRILGTKADENVADAINIGWKVIHDLRSGSFKENIA